MLVSARICCVNCLKYIENKLWDNGEESNTLEMTFKLYNFSFLWKLK